MAAIEPKRAERRAAAFGTLALLLLSVATPLLADRASDVRTQISYVATALGNANPSDALGPFDKSFKDYEKLRSYFEALTTGFDITSELEILDEQDEEAQTKLLVNWIITLTNPRAASDLNASISERRSTNVNIRLALKKGKWKIVDFSPIEIFDPQRRSSGKN